MGARNFYWANSSNMISFDCIDFLDFDGFDESEADIYYDKCDKGIEDYKKTFSDIFETIFEKEIVDYVFDNYDSCFSKIDKKVLFAVNYDTVSSLKGFNDGEVIDDVEVSLLADYYMFKVIAIFRYGYYSGISFDYILTDSYNNILDVFDEDELEENFLEFYKNEKDGYEDVLAGIYEIKEIEDDKLREEMEEKFSEFLDCFYDLVRGISSFIDDLAQNIHNVLIKKMKDTEYIDDDYLDYDDIIKEVYKNRFDKNTHGKFDKKKVINHIKQRLKELENL